MDAQSYPLSRLVERLDRDGKLSDAEVEKVLSLSHTVRSYPANADIVREGDRPSQCCLVIEGCLSRFKIIKEGKKQIMSFHVPGDIPDTLSLYLPRLDHTLGSVSPTKVVFIPHAAMRDLMALHPRIAQCLWREMLVDAAIFREWIINVGRRAAESRIAHLLCEQAVRMKEAGLGDESGYPWFLTQANLGDATGLSVVHVNRSMQSLRHKGLIGENGKTMKILDWKGLVEVAGFDPAYLHLAA